MASSITNSTPRFTEALRSAAGGQWDRVVNHKFTSDLASGEIDRAILKRYLIQDHRFLDAFTSLLGALICKARCLEDRIPACQFAALITSDENTYFLRCFEKLGCADAKMREAVPSAACTTGFIDLMTEVATTGTLGEILSVLVVCEWSYLTWGARVAPTANRDHFECYEWVDLHSGDGFTGVVNYLRGLLDKEGDLIDEKDRAKCKTRFLQAVQLEEDFFDNAYAK
mmetsp:Transcript_20110/g.57710  ORF Transcript_20110/g.57710 Transcript_20110/m.57710 type:complete len:227 (-) Transcript_20110:1187-1867(-)